MKISKKTKWVVAVSLLAVSILTAGVALAAPSEQKNIPSPAVLTEQAKSTAEALQVKPFNNNPEPVCDYSNCTNNKQCLQNSVSAAQVIAPDNGAVCPNFDYNYNHSHNRSNTGPNGYMAGKYGHGVGHGQGGR